jgi:hypothetical protein
VALGPFVYHIMSTDRILAWDNEGHTAMQGVAFSAFSAPKPSCMGVTKSELITLNDHICRMATSYKHPRWREAGGAGLCVICGTGARPKVNNKAMAWAKVHLRDGSAPCYCVGNSKLGPRLHPSFLAALGKLSAEQQETEALHLHCHRTCIPILPAGPAGPSSQPFTEGSQPLTQQETVGNREQMAKKRSGSHLSPIPAAGADPLALRLRPLKGRQCLAFLTLVAFTITAGVRSQGQLGHRYTRAGSL